MSSRIFQNVIIQMKDAIDRTIGVVDDQGYVVASSELAIIGSRLDDFHAYELEDAEHPLECGIEIRVQPPASSSRPSRCSPAARRRLSPLRSILQF